MFLFLFPGKFSTKKAQKAFFIFHQTGGWIGGRPATKTPKAIALVIKAINIFFIIPFLHLIDFFNIFYCLIKPAYLSIVV